MERRLAQFYALVVFTLAVLAKTNAQTEVLDMHNNNNNNNNNPHYLPTNFPSMVACIVDVSTGTLSQPCDLVSRFVTCFIVEELRRTQMSSVQPDSIAAMQAVIDHHLQTYPFNVDDMNASCQIDVRAIFAEYVPVQPRMERNSSDSSTSTTIVTPVTSKGDKTHTEVTPEPEVEPQPEVDPVPESTSEPVVQPEESTDSQTPLSPHMCLQNLMMTVTSDYFRGLFSNKCYPVEDYIHCIIDSMDIANLMETSSLQSLRDHLKRSMSTIADKTGNCDNAVDYVFDSVIAAQIPSTQPTTRPPRFSPSTSAPSGSRTPSTSPTVPTTSEGISTTTDSVDAFHASVQSCINGLVNNTQNMSSPGEACQPMRDYLLCIFGVLPTDTPVSTNALDQMQTEVDQQYPGCNIDVRGMYLDFRYSTQSTVSTTPSPSTSPTTPSSSSSSSSPSSSSSSSPSSSSSSSSSSSPSSSQSPPSPSPSSPSSSQSSSPRTHSPSTPSTTPCIKVPSDCLDRPTGPYQACPPDCENGVFYVCVHGRALKRQCPNGWFGGASYLYPLVYDPSAQECRFKSQACPRPQDVDVN